MLFIAVLSAILTVSTLSLLREWARGGPAAEAPADRLRDPLAARRVVFTSGGMAPEHLRRYVGTTRTRRAA